MKYVPGCLTDDQSALIQEMARCHQVTSHSLSQCQQRSMMPLAVTGPHWVNTLRPRQDGRQFPDDILKCIFLNENVWITIKISLKFVPKGPINNTPAMVQIMAWRRPGDKPLSEPMMVSLLTHICVARPQWVNSQDSHILPLQQVIKEFCKYFGKKWMHNIPTFRAGRDIMV